MSQNSQQLEEIGVHSWCEHHFRFERLDTYLILCEFTPEWSNGSGPGPGREACLQQTRVP